MSKGHKFFRYLWRINAVLILLAAATITIGVGTLLLQDVWRTVGHREGESGIALPSTNSGDRLSLGRASVVPGTDVLRAQLTTVGGGPNFSSGGYSEIRNILFIDPAQKSAHWLLPDNEHIISDNLDIAEEDRDRPKHMFATVLLVKAARELRGQSSGRLLMFDPTGKNIVEVADSVSDLQLATFSSGFVTILYERNQKLVLATFDPGTLAKNKGQEIEVPELK